MHSDINGICSHRLRVHWNRELLTQRLKLVNCRGTVHVGGHHKRSLPLLPQVVSKLRGSGRFTRTLQATRLIPIGRVPPRAGFVLPFSAPHHLPNSALTIARTSRRGERPPRRSAP